MNNDRRKQLNEAIDKLVAMKDRISELVTETEEAYSLIADIRDAEQEAYDNLPESLQNGDKGQSMESAISLMEEVHNAMESLNGELAGIEIDDLVSQLDDAKGC